MIKINIPNNIENCIERLERAGYEAYIVGGCVRDAILGREPNDWDLCTSALPNDIKDVFEDYKTIDIGSNHGTIAVVIDGDAVEITTFRIDGEYSDNRRPDYVEFTSSLREDLKRRDFTINAMAYSKNTGIIDYFNGQDDIEKKLIRCVGEAEKRLEEDALRILRGIRFASQLDYNIEDSTLRAMESCKLLVTNVSRERIREEISKLILGDYPDKGFEVIKKLGLAPILLKGVVSLEGLHNEDLWREASESIKKLHKDLVLRTSVLLKLLEQSYGVEDLGFDSKVLKSLRFDNVFINETHRIFENYNLELVEDRVVIKTQLNAIGVKSFKRLLKIRGLNKDEAEKIVSIYEMVKEIIKAKEPYEIKDLKINGDDLQKAGIPRGRQLGNTLRYLLEVVIKNPEYNNKETLLKLVSKIDKEIIT